ncbi:MAG TPA: glycerol-3-phosphate 1-O-acyltransferase PlsY [Gemmatimonadales bacterium]|nr:glycerol-3-phosphate 1-O-acyltransferase PlsY [Gemmatimonadales bacterium]
MSHVIALLASYFIGAVPNSYLAGRLFKGIDLREHGSGNLGATNVWRTLGPKFAIPVGLLDTAKGAIPVLFIAPLASDARLFALACGIMAVVGHVFSIFVGFKGGKGVATAAGVMLGLTPLAVLVTTAVWLLLVWTTGYSSLGSIVGAALLPLAAWLLHPADRDLVWVQALVALAIIWFHRANIRRLLAGTESRFGKRHRQAPVE